MKNSVKLTFLTAIVASSTFLAGCFGYYPLIRKVYTWNSKLFSDNLGGRFLRNIVSLLLSPVYGVAGFVDTFILNLIEFWTGSNPMALKEGETEVQTIVYHGESYRLIMSRHRFDMEILTGSHRGERQSLSYSEQTRTWQLENKTGKLKIAEFNNDFTLVTIYTPTGPIVCENQEEALHTISDQSIHADRR